MFVLLSSVGNIDYGQNPYEGLLGVPREWRPVNTLEEASLICREYIDEHDLGGGNWYGGYVFDSLELTNQVAYISYNGRIWTDENMQKYQERF